MNLLPASSCATNKGVNCLIYGPPGSGKTPMSATAPNPIMLHTESGLLSLSESNIPVCVAHTKEEIDDFISWYKSSNESGKYETLIIDSVTEYAQVIVDHYKKSAKHGQQAYGLMCDEVLDALRFLCKVDDRHLVMIAHEKIIHDGETHRRVPTFPGNALDVSIPHMVDMILCAGTFNVPKEGRNRCLLSQETPTALARDRSGKLSKFLQTNLSEIIIKSTNPSTEETQNG